MDNNPPATTSVQLASESEIDSILAVMNHPEVALWQLPNQNKYHDEYFTQIMRGAKYDAVGCRHFIYAITHDGECIGYILVSIDGPLQDDQAMIGFDLHPDYWGNGHMTEAITKLVPHIAAKHGLSMVCAQCFPKNARCRKTLRNCGFRRVGRSPARWLYNFVKGLPQVDTYYFHTREG